jgi:nicotinamidase-related amidase
MSTVVNLRDFKERGRGLPTLVLVDMHYHQGGISELDGTAVLAEAMANCRAALRHARACAMPVAFTRQVAPPATMLASPSYPRWVEGFEPNRWDMVFDRHRPSCYGSAEFRDLADEIGGDYAIAGQFAEISCIATLIDASHRDHRPIFLSDALVSRPHKDVSAGAMLKAATHILSHFAEPARTKSWILATSRRAGAYT